MNYRKFYNLYRACKKEWARVDMREFTVIYTPEYEDLFNELRMKHEMREF